MKEDAAPQGWQLQAPGYGSSTWAGCSPFSLQGFPAHIQKSEARTIRFDTRLPQSLSTERHVLALVAGDSLGKSEGRGSSFVSTRTSVVSNVVSKGAAPA